LYNAETIENDIAILKLGKPTKKMQAVDRAAIRLPTIPDAVWLTQPYVPMYTAGWGRTTDSNMLDTLSEVALPVVDHETCGQKLAAIGEIVPVGTMCAGFVSGEYDSCQGDSGGGLFYRPAAKGTPRSMEPILAGITSWGIGCGSPGVFGVYTNIWYYRGWMEQIVSGYYRER
jgi:secreted trypsin-like serine protease